MRLINQVVQTAVVSLLFGLPFKSFAQSVAAQPLVKPEMFYSLQNTNVPPLPFNPFPSLPLFPLGNDRFVIDDRSVDYVQLRTEAELKAAALAAESDLIAPLADGSGGWGPLLETFSYAPGDLWLEMTNVTNDWFSLALHGTELNGYYQLLTKTDLNAPDWTLAYSFYGSDGVSVLGDLVSTSGGPRLFFAAARSTNVVRISLYDEFDDQAVEPASARNDPGHTNAFLVSRAGPWDSDLTVYYHVGGAASNGVDYTFIPGMITIPAQRATARIAVQPIEDNLFEFGESLTLTLIQTNSYWVDSPPVTITINDNRTNSLFTIVAYLNSPIGIDYHPPTQSLLVSINHDTSGQPDFARIDSNGAITPWSGVQGLIDEVKIATVKATANGFNIGDMFFGNATNIGWLSADGTVANLNWATLTNSAGATNDTLLRGGLYVDQTGIFGGDLIAVTGAGQFEGGGVWRINSSGSATRLANITNTHLEGVITLPNDVQKWGPWAGKIITGAESKDPPLIYAIDTNGIVTSFALGIEPEDFEIIPPDQDLYCVDPAGLVVKLSRTLLADYVGDLLITQAGEFFNPAKLFIVHWDGSNFITWIIAYIDYGRFEHVTFAPINIPDL